MAQPSASIFISTPKKRILIPFMATLGGGLKQTYLGGPISISYRIVNVEIVFRNDAANLLQIYIFTSRNSNVSTTVPLPDDNLFSLYSPNGFFLGEGLIKSMNINFIPDPANQYIKVYAANGCAYPQTINVTVTIEEM